MALRASPKAGRKKVRCPKCTALFVEPSKSAFECPICSCHLSGNGANATVQIPTKEGDSAQRKASTGSHEPIKMQKPMDSVEKEGSFSDGNDMTQEKKATCCEQDSVAAHTQILKKREQQPIAESPQDDINEQPSTEGISREDGTVRALSPMHCASKPGNFMSRKEKGESLLRLVASANEEAALAITKWQCSSDDASKENSSVVKEESNSISNGDEGLEKINVVSSNQRLQSQILRTTRCEFSFKYALGGASPLESDGESFHRKRSPLSSEAPDMPLHTPLRIRISKSHDESSDQSENGRHSSFSCETDSEDGSGSDFDFPAPWAEGVPDIELPASFGQNDNILPNSLSMVSTAPHQLELLDAYDTVGHEESTSQQESSKHDTDLSSQVENVDKTSERECELRDEESSLGLVQPNHMSLGPPDRVEITITESKPLSSHTQHLDVSHLARHMSSAMLNDNLHVVGNNTVPFMEGCKEKLGGSGFEECSRGGEEQEALEPMHVVGQQDLEIKDQCNGKQDSMNAKQEDPEDPKSAPSMRDADLTNLATLPNQEYSNRKPSTSNLDHTEMAELEQDLYKLHLPAYGNDSFSGGSSHSALWAEEETTVSALSDGTFSNTSKVRLYQEEKNPCMSSHGIFHGNSGSRPTRSDNGKEHFMSGQEKSLKGLPSSRETSSQATYEHVDWKGNILAAEEQSGHPDLHEIEGKPGPYSQYPVNNSLGFSHANPPSYALPNHHYGFGALGASHICPYQLPSQSSMHPASHCGYHAMSPACMVCYYQYHQHPHMHPQHIPPHCGVCFSQSGSMAYSPGIVEHWNCHQGHHGSASSCASSLVDYPQASASTNLIQSHGEFKPRAPSARKPNQLPPFPKNGAAPYVTCKGCSRVLQVPSHLPVNCGNMQKLRCGACGKVTKFSINCYDQQRPLVSATLPLELGSMGGVANMPPSVQYGTHSRQVPVSSHTTSMESSYRQDMLKVNPVPHWSNEVSPQAYEMTTSGTSKQNAQGGEIFGVQPINCVMDASHNNYGECDPWISVGATPVQDTSSVLSPRNAVIRSTDSFGFERSKVNPAASFPSTVDEKEEGLDFGAPRISDGDSLDHSESRLRSPEHHQVHYEETHIFQGTPTRAHQPLEQVSDSIEDHSTTEEKRPGSPLLVLLNQESTRFRLKLEPRVRFEAVTSAVSSPASDSPLYANSINNQPQKGEQGNHRSNSSPGQHFVSKGPRYIAGLLRRSLRDFGRGGQ